MDSSNTNKSARFDKSVCSSGKYNKLFNNVCKSYNPNNSDMCVSNLVEKCQTMTLNTEANIMNKLYTCYANGTNTQNIKKHQENCLNMIN